MNSNTERIENTDEISLNCHAQPIVLLTPYVPKTPFVAKSIKQTPITTIIVTTANKQSKSCDGLVKLSIV